MLTPEAQRSPKANEGRDVRTVSLPCPFRPVAVIMTRLQSIRIDRLLRTFTHRRATANMSFVRRAPWLTVWLMTMTVCVSPTAAVDPPQSAGEPVFSADESGFRRHLDQFLTVHCLRCHGPEQAEGEFRIDRDLSPRFDDLTTKGKWGEVVNVLNSHEMPPEEEPQPAPESVAEMVDWITSQMVSAERLHRETQVVIRRLNRDEYRNTIRDLTGVDFDTSHFPQDPPAGGFDNNGSALTMSPLLMELYFDSATQILERAFVDGDAPPSIRWRFEPESGDSDSNRVTYDDQRLIVNGGRNRVDGDAIVMHHESWDRTFNVRDFRLKHAGPYRIRIHASGRVPSRDEIVSGARGYLEKRRDEELQKQPEREKYILEQFERDLQHFRTAGFYDYGPPRLKVTVHLAGQPKVVAELDIDTPPGQPQTFDIPAEFSTESAGITLEYAYHIPRELENFWMQSGDDFARPEARIDWMELEGPVYTQWPPASQTKLLPDPQSLGLEPDAAQLDADTAKSTAYVQKVLARFMQRAYRRPVSKSELAAKLELYQAARREGLSLREAIKRPLKSMLVSPHFLYLDESPVGDNATATIDPLPLNDYQLASRLSCFLWSSMPDDALFRAAGKRELSTAAGRQREVARMLADPRSEAFIENFAGQWLGLREVGANPPAPDLYRHYDRHLETSMVRESLAFFAEILRHDLDAANLIDSPFVIINERLARFYEIPGVRGDHFRRVAVASDSHRGGVLTQASMLTITSNGTRTSPVKRGTWILKNILGTDPGLPVANAGEIAPKVPGIDKATVRQRLEIHRELPQCARCHDKIDPLGFALENYDASGRYREQEGHGYQGRIEKNDPPIDASSRLPDGTQIDGIEGLKQALSERRQLFYHCLATKLFTYALGRELTYADRPAVDRVVKQWMSKPTLAQLIELVVDSEPFLTK